MKIEKLAASKTNIFSTESKKGIFDVSDASLGLGNLLDTQKKEEEVKKTVEESDAESTKGPATPFDLDGLKFVWSLYLDELKANNDIGFFYSAMSVVELNLDETTWEINFVLKNATEEKEWLNRKPDLIGFVRNKLNNFKLTLSWMVDVNTDKIQLYTNRDRFARLAEKNPKLLDLKSKLDLEIE